MDSVDRVESKTKLNALEVQEAPAPREQPLPKGFPMIMVALSAALFLSAFELTSVSTALPTIVHSIPNFPAQDFVWVGSAYALASAAFLPMSGALSQVFGRKPLMLVSLAIFTIGSAVSGAAHTTSVLLFGRTAQGLGGGGIVAMCNIILSDIVPLYRRPKYNAVLAVTWCFAAAIGPVIGGLVAQKGAWRWLFWLNLPVCGITAAIVVFVLHLKTPKLSFNEKVKRIDWIGNVLIIGTTTAAVLGLTWGGVVFAWSSAKVLVPLIIGVVGIALTFVHQAYVPKEPTIPVFLLKDRTSLSGQLQTMIVQIIIISYVYYFPVYFQACKLASPIRSGIDLLGLTLAITPIAMCVGISIAILQRYRPQIWTGWVLIIISTGLLTTVKADDSIWRAIGFCILGGAGLGTVYTAVIFPVLAPLPVSANAQAIALSMFLRVFGQIWGVTIGGAVLQNVLRSNLPSSVVSQLPDNLQGDVAYATITIIKGLPLDIQNEVRDVFAKAMKELWQVMVGIAAAGFLVSLAMGDVKMHKHTAEEYGVDDGQERKLSASPDGSAEA